MKHIRIPNLARSLTQGSGLYSRILLALHRLDITRSSYVDIYIFFNLWFITLGHTLRWWKITDWWARISKRTCTYLNKCPTWRVGQQPKFRPLMWFSDMGLQVMMKGFILFQLLLRANTTPEVEEYLWMCWAHVLNVPKFSLLLVVAIY